MAFSKEDVKILEDVAEVVELKPETNVVVRKAFYHYTWCVSLRNIDIGSLAPSGYDIKGESVSPYLSVLCFEAGGERYSSKDLREIATELDKLNTLGSDRLNKIKY